MGTPPTRNASNLTVTPANIESEDDEPGIRGLSSSTTPPHRPWSPSNQPRAALSAPRNVQSSHTTAVPPPRPRSDSSNAYDDEFPASSKTSPKHGFLDPLSAVGARQALGVTSSSPALTLDRFVLGHTGVDAHEAHGSVSKPRDHSAISSLKDAFGSDMMAGSPPSWETASTICPATPTLSPPNSDDSSTSSQDSEASRESQHARSSPPELIPVKQLIKQVCVAGLQSGRARDARFCLGVPQLTEICRAAREAFLSEPTLLRLDGPIKIVGDIHGQFKDLMRLFKRGGMPPDQHYLFLGDYVDRGKQSLETIVLLLLLKLRYPTRMHMLRGNHESAGITKVYGFYDECKRRSSLRAWRAFVDVFNCLPVAAIVGERIFCVHGGISPSLSNTRQIEAIQRPTDVPDQGILADLLWSDPDAQVKEWSENDRGVSFCFGQRSLDRFCRQLDVDLVVRGHMVVETGYEFFGNRRLVTVFSAPNYCGDFDNCAAVMQVSETLLCSFDVIEPRTVRRPPERSSSPQAASVPHELPSRPNDIGVS